MPWAWGQRAREPAGVYHLVWSRDLYQVATALLAAGDRAGASRSLDYLFMRQQKPDGSLPAELATRRDENWRNLQLDEVAIPIVLAWQLGRTDAGPRAGQGGRRLHPRERPADAAGALGEPGRLVARHDRVGDRRARRRADIARAERRRARPRRAGRRRRTSGSEACRLDRHDQRPATRRSPTTCAYQGRRAERRPRRTTSATRAGRASTSAGWSTRASSSSCASASSRRTTP